MSEELKLAAEELEYLKKEVEVLNRLLERQRADHIRLMKELVDTFRREG